MMTLAQKQKRLLTLGRCCGRLWRALEDLPVPKDMQARREVVAAVFELTMPPKYKRAMSPKYRIE